MKQYKAILSDYLTMAEQKMSILILIIYSVGIAGMAIPVTREFFVGLIPFVLVLSLIVTLSFHRESWDLKTIGLFTAIVLFSWIIEAAGVATGIIFGNYTYGPSLGLKVLETPLLIGLNWLLLIYGTAGITERLPLSKAGKIILASLLMVIYDVILELAAPALGMWQFDDGFAPPENYIAWFLIALVFHTILRVSGIKISNILAPVIFVIQFIFFLALILIFQLKK
jgi:putative membrane protein